MRLNNSTVVAGLTLLIGAAFSEGHLWIPMTVLAAGIVDLFTRSWVTSSRVGQWARVSVFIKFVLSLVGLYATLGQLACLGLIGWWLIS